MVKYSDKTKGERKLITSILLKQIITMFMLMGVGAALYKLKFITDQGAKEFGNVLLRIIIPSVIVKSYIVEFTPENSEICGCLLALLFWDFFWQWVSLPMFMEKESQLKTLLLHTLMQDSFGIPLTQAVFGSEAVFYVAAYVTLLNLFQWTYGVFVMTGETENIKPKNLIANPMLLSMIIGLIIFLFSIPVPETVVTTIGFLASMNTPVAMLVLGIFLAKADIKDIFFDYKIYPCMAMRLLVIPLITLVVFYFLPIKNTTMVMSVLIAACTSVGGNIVIFAQQYDRNYLLAIKTVCLSTILSIVTIPLFLWLYKCYICRKYLKMDEKN